VPDYKKQHPEIPVIVRFQHPRNWHQDPTASARHLGEMVASKWPDLKDMDPYVYFANEVNLHYENGDNNVSNQPLYESREFYKRYANWVKMTADRIKQRAPRMKLVCPPFAFGHHEDGAPDDNGNPTEGWAGYDYLADTIRSHFANIITFHAYWGHASGSVHEWLYDPTLSSWYAFRWRRVLNLFQRRYGIRARVLIDEAGNMRASDPDFTDQIMYHASQCLADERVMAVTYFLWQDPTNHPGNVMNSWVQSCANPNHHIARLATMPDIIPVVGGVPAVWCPLRCRPDGRRRHSKLRPSPPAATLWRPSTIRATSSRLLGISARLLHRPSLQGVTTPTPTFVLPPTARSATRPASMTRPIKP